MESNAEKIAKLNSLSGHILDSAIEVHRIMGGPGLLESVYEEALAHELKLRGNTIERQVPIPVTYKGYNISKPLILDLFVNKRIIIEVKSVEKFNHIYNAQLLTYLRLTNIPLGIVVNFGEKYIKDGFHRVVNNFPRE